MSAGTAISDLLPVPAAVAPVLEEKEEVAQTLEEKPTDSHALALEEQDIKDAGAAQLAHDEDVNDLGWNADSKLIPDPLIGKLPNEELWILLRRFDKQIYHLREVPNAVPGGLDLNITDDDEFSPDKLRSTLERLYMTVIIGLIGFGKHIVRLRSWRETRRTTYFCVAYSIAWLLDLIVPLILLTLIVLLTYPPSRSLLFPPAPLALVDSSTGGIQKPAAGVLGSHDSVTGAPENFKGEAVEQEASNFVNGIATVALSSAAGKHPQDDPPEGQGVANDSVPDPTAFVSGAADAKERAAGGAPTAKHDKTKVPMEAAIWTKMRPAMHGLGDVCDTWERFGNALSPTPPFPTNLARVRLAGVLVPILIASLFTSSYMMSKVTGFGAGFGFFGEPLIQRGLEYLNSHYPNWQKLLEMRNTLLKGVPTNAQLTITLLRVGEANKAPLPPAPSTNAPPPEAHGEITHDHLNEVGGELTSNATQEEINEAVAAQHAAVASGDAHTGHATTSDVAAAKDAKQGKKGSKLLGFFRVAAKGAVEAAISADSIKARVGSAQAKNRLGVIPKRGDVPISGPVDFKARFHGRKGHAYLSMGADGLPYVGFSTDKAIDKVGSAEAEELHPSWMVPVGEIAELKKVGGYGWKAKLVVGWALGREVSDGLEIVERSGTRWTVTAMPLRNELFNRLCAMGGQKWESC